ncbi:MAG: RES family NAD+ phosphorylase [Acidobacteriia bacterium]|nr:RES family NAD+ phosphorylase [Terriglobia bacterium]
MILWRISNHASLDGRGGLTASARWHTRPRLIVYLAETATGALAEALVHLELDPNHLPRNYKLLKAEAPDDISIRHITKPDLPANWAQDAVVTRTIGDEWLALNETVLLRVPSAIAPESFNVLLNPMHREAARVVVVDYREYPWDRRLLE